MSPATTRRDAASPRCGGCGFVFGLLALPAECPHCGERLSAAPRQLREAELEDRARHTRGRHVPTN